MQPRIVECGWKCETKSDEVHVFFSFFIFTELDTAQPRRRTRVQLILFSIFSELARRLIPPAAPKRRCWQRACLTSNGLAGRMGCLATDFQSCGFGEAIGIGSI